MLNINKTKPIYQIVIIPTKAVDDPDVILTDEKLLMSLSDQLLLSNIVKETLNEYNIMFTHINNEYKQSIHYTVYDYLQIGIYDIYFETNDYPSSNMANMNLFRKAFRIFGVKRLLN